MGLAFGRRLAVGLTLLLLLLAGPAAAAPKTEDIKPDPKVAWILVGVAPDNARIVAPQVDLKNGVVTKAHFAIGLRGPTEGFVMLKAKPDAVYGINFAALIAGKSIFGLSFNPCEKMITFHSKAGTVTYVGSFTFWSDGNYLRFANRDDLAGARAFLSAHYPGLAESIEENRATVMPYSGPCL